MRSSIPDDLLVAIAEGKPLREDTIVALDTDVNAFGELIPRTMLMAAAFGGQVGLINYLVGKGAKLNLCNHDGMTPLHEAVGQGQRDAVVALLNLGADLEARTQQGHTPLMVAAAWGYRDIVRLLIDSGADISIRDKQGLTAKNIAEEKNEHEVADMLTIERN
jgi:ankyrin repeat protein